MTNKVMNFVRNIYTSIKEIDFSDFMKITFYSPFFGLWTFIHLFVELKATFGLIYVWLEKFKFKIVW